MCFGGSDSSGKMIKMQEQEADESRRKETERQGRISSGLERIRQAFEGSPVMGTRRGSAGYDWNQKGAGLPVGFQYVPEVAATAATPGAVRTAAIAERQGVDARAGRSVSMGGYSGRQVQPAYRSRTFKIGEPGNIAINGKAVPPGTPTPGTAGTPGSEAYIIGPDGKRYKKGDLFGYDEQYDTGQRSGGFGDDFFNQFRDAMTSYYMPQVQEQYGDAKDELTYRLARAGTLRSSGAIGEQADLAKQNALREGEVRTKADEAVGGLRDRLATERSKAESQLYATEDPDVAANQALAAVENISAEKPTLTPLGALFDIASIGGAGAASGYQNAEYLKNYGLKGRSQDASRNVYS